MEYRYEVRINEFIDDGEFTQQILESTRLFVTFVEAMRYVMQHIAAKCDCTISEADYDIAEYVYRYRNYVIHGQMWFRDLKQNQE